jgi:NitT/TauT family transport system substrate-binding protein
MTGEAAIKSMDLVRTSPSITAFWGKERRSVDVVGIQFPRTSSLGDPTNIKMRFDPRFTKMAVDGQL